MAEMQYFKIGEAINQGQALAMNNYRLGETARAVKARSGLEGALRAGTPEAMKTYQQNFPIEAEQYKAETRGTQLKKVIDEINFVEKIAGGIQDQASLDMARQQMQAAGKDVSNIPSIWNDQARAFIEQQKKQAMGFKGQAEMELREIDKAHAKAVLEETSRHNRAAEEKSKDVLEETRRHNIAMEGKESTKAKQGSIVELRKEFNALPEVKNYKTVLPIIESVNRAPDTPAGDIDLIYGVGKIMDPDSVVREGEMNIVIKSGSPAQRLTGFLEYVQGGGRLTQDQRKQLIEVMESRVKGLEENYTRARGAYGGIATKQGLDPEDIFIESPLRSRKPTQSTTNDPLGIR